MYVRMSLKGIWVLSLALFAAVPARALEERIAIFPDSSAESKTSPDLRQPRAIGAWSSDGAVLKKGFRDRAAYSIAHAAYHPDDSVDLLLHFDRPATADETGNWKVASGRSTVYDAGRALLGEAAGSFNGPDSTLNLEPTRRSIFGDDSRFRDFSLEFWLFPANAENGEVLLSWQSLRKLPGGVLPQQLSCAIAGGRLMWSFAGFFSPPDATRPEQASTRIELRATSPLVPRMWSHHLVRFDGDSGLLEYLVDGEPEAVAYATSTGREGGTVHAPAVGAASPIRLFPEYAGLADELRLSRRFVERPSLEPYGRESALVLSPVVDLGYGNSRLTAVDAELRLPGRTGIELAYRVSDDWTGWRADSPEWIPFRPGEALGASARGRYAQVKAELFPDGSGRLAPTLASLAFRYEPDPPPPPPARLAAAPKDGAIELRWSRVPEADLAGYLVYYGDRPGEYFGTGADQGPSPVDAGDATSLTMTGIPNGRLLYFAVAAYDAAPGDEALRTGAAGSRAVSRAGAFSPEIAARPSRTQR